MTLSEAFHPQNYHGIEKNQAEGIQLKVVAYGSARFSSTVVNLCSHHFAKISEGKDFYGRQRLCRRLRRKFEAAVYGLLLQYWTVVH